MLEIAFKASQQKVNVIRKVLIIIITYVSISLDMLIIFVRLELLLRYSPHIVCLVRSCIVIQKTWRGRKGKERVKWRKRSIVRVQCCVRVWRAKRQLKILKVLYSIYRKSGIFHLFSK